MSARPWTANWGADLTASDYERLSARWITRELAEVAGLRRVDSSTGREMFGRKRGDCAGVIIPNVAPWNPDAPREFRIRLDSPELEYHSDGTTTQSRKYLQPPGRPNLMYFPPGIPLKALDDVSLPAIISEGEFKGLSLSRLANYQTDSRRFLPLALPGVWNFKGTIGKTTGANGARQDVSGIIADIERIKWKARRVIIAYDADAKTKASVRAARWQLTSALMERGAVVGFLEWPAEQGKGIDDRLAKVGPERVLADIAAVEFGDWRARLLRNDQGRVMSCYDNVGLFLENAAEWAGTLGYNEFTAGCFILKTPPAPVTAEAVTEIADHFDTEVVRWLERHGLIVRPDLVRRVVDAVARRNAYHPVREYLTSLPWDGVPRIGDWLSRYCGAERSRYAAAVGEMFLVSAVARVMEPGCKADHVLILEGPQGIGKSSAARVLAGDEWFADQLADMGSKDAAMQVRGVWIVELGELDVLNRAEMARAKAFLTQQIERFRLPYGRRIVQVPRQCVFLGTTNAEEWMRDETGARRFWPVRCLKIDLPGLKRDRDQLWAEALRRYHDGARWHITDPTLIEAAIEEQRARFIRDPWHEKVIEYAEQEAVSDFQDSASLASIMARLGIPTEKRDQASANRVARILKFEGWTRFYSGPRSKRVWRYRKPGPESEVES
jgi:predicted P-loop ATPase